MIDYVRTHVLPAALSLLPPHMDSPRARAMLLAIGRQESGFVVRRQLQDGPALSLWQYEPGELSAVPLLLRHPVVGGLADGVCWRLCYEPNPEAIRRATEHNDVLAAAFARLLLWTVPASLPGPADVDEAWRQYLAAWRPGRPRPGHWPGHYREAWRLVEGG